MIYDCPVKAKPADDFLRGAVPGGQRPVNDCCRAGGQSKIRALLNT
jgi:hypothetical protein